jgi:hypothetical protein
MVLKRDFSYFDALVADRDAHPSRRFAASYGSVTIPAAIYVVPGISAQGKYTCVL